MIRLRPVAEDLEILTCNFPFFLALTNFVKSKKRKNVCKQANHAPLI